uniref:Uncharacterized protein n=1 Tax=Anopheles minimus TaxID=112268 RepID=A0A182WQ88_9DIPT
SQQAVWCLPPIELVGVFDYFCIVLFHFFSFDPYNFVSV